MLDWNYACERFLISLGDSCWGIIAIILMLVFNPLSFGANGVENLIAGGYSVREVREHKGKWCEERKLREEEPWRAGMLLILAGEMFVCRCRVWLHVGCCVAAEAGVSFCMIFPQCLFLPMGDALWTEWLVQEPEPISVYYGNIFDLQKCWPNHNKEQ